MVHQVTPCVGVWIEIDTIDFQLLENGVTPCVGVWIEIIFVLTGACQCLVTPCVGVWIEIILGTVERDSSGSLPAWECGLKSRWNAP